MYGFGGLDLEHYLEAKPENGFILKPYNYSYVLKAMGANRMAEPL
jgi:hypothetical protein